MALNYVYKADRPMLSGLAAEDGILPGEVMYADSTGVSKATFADGMIHGICESFPDAHVARHENDYRSDIDAFTYDTGDRVKFGGAESQAYVRALTPADNGTDPSADIGAWDIVGVTDLFPGRVIQEGYTDAGAVTYDRASGNFLPIGQARGNASNLPVSDFDSLVHVIRRTDF